MGRKTGNGVHFIKDDIPVRTQEHVHPCEAPAAEHTVYDGSRILYPCGRICVDSCGHVDFCACQCIFFGVIKKTAGQFDLIDLADD